MSLFIQPFNLLVSALAGWINRDQHAAIDYLIEENRVLKDQLEVERLRFTDEQRIRLAVKAKAVGRRLLREIDSYYHTERNHQGVGNRLLEPCAMSRSTADPVHCRERLGGMLNFYHREAA